MLSVKDLLDGLAAIYPLSLAEDWDNTGLLIGDRNCGINRVMTCLTISSRVVDEAVSEKADLIVSHHPFPFRSEKRWTTDTPNGMILHRLIQGRISVYSPHTAHDSAFWGVNRQLADLYNLQNVKPLIAENLIADDSMLAGITPEHLSSLKREIGTPIGTARIGSLPIPLTLSGLIEKTEEILKQPVLTFVGHPNHTVSKMAIACGAADDFILNAASAGADLLLLGEARFHSALLAEELNLPLILPGHYATERFAMDTMAARLQALYPDLTIWGSRKERDPIQYHSQKTRFEF